MKVSLAAARVNAKLTQDQVASTIHKNKQTIVNWENGKTKIDPANFIVLCRLYKADEDDIILPNSLT